MASEKQIAANKLNAQKSTGPGTAEGKSIASRNALKHGVLSASVLLPDEDKKSFQSLQNQVFEHYQPTGGREELLVDRIIAYMWRLKRLFLIETWSLKPDTWLDHTETSTERMIANRFVAQSSQLLVLSRYEVSIERMMARAIQELEYVQAKRAGHQLAVIDAEFKK